ncbi:MAG: hypothetical protein MR411_01475 [Tenericutes bacterium]|nr:hypothetical protein [Mycoplasmatota bacterium]
MKNKTIAIITFIIILFDFLLTLIIVGYQSNLLAIAAIIFAITKMNSKQDITKYLSYFIIIISVILIGYNTTQKKYYVTKVGNKNIKIEVPNFIIKKGKNQFKVIFKDNATKNIKKYLNNLSSENCNTKAYYDKKQNISLINYYVNENNEINFKIVSGKFCDSYKKETYNNYVPIKELRRKYSKKESIKDGYYVRENNKIYNKNTLKEFFNKVEKKKTAFLRIIDVNELDQVTVTDITYKNNKFEIEYDNTRDTKINPSTSYYKIYKNLGIKNNNLYAYIEEYGDGLNLGYVE